MRLATAFFA
ncbi:hypothetical protein YPPY36_5036, partial [Yersinia pestis PY-36]